MNVTQLKYLRAVISEGSFAKAAQALYVSPQAISKAIKALEEELRFPLFTREGRGIAPTDVAVRFSKQAEDAVRSFDDLAIYASGCQEADEACDIRLGVVEAASRCQVFFPEDFSPYRATHRSTKLHLTFLANESCVAALRSGMLDAAIVLGTIDGCGFEHHRVGMLHPHAVMMRTHELARRSRLVLDDLDGRPVALPVDRGWMLPRMAEQCRLRRIVPRFADLPPSREAAGRFIRQGGIVLVARENRFAAPPADMASLPFDADERFTVPLNLVHRSDRSRAIARLYAFIATMARQNFAQARESA